MSDDEFLTKVVADAELPDTKVVKVQLAWILEWAADPDRGVRAMPVVAGGFKSLREKISVLRKALQKAELIRASLASWSEGTGKEAEFYRSAISAALEGSAVVPLEMVGNQEHAWFIRRVERLLPPIHDGIVSELRKIEHFASERHPRIQYDPKERVIVLLLWLVFEISLCRVTMSSRGSATPSRFQKTCIAICDRATYTFRPGSGPEKLSSNFQNRIIDAVNEGNSDGRLCGIKAVAERTRRSPGTVSNEMSAWTDWLTGFPIPKVTSNDQE